VLARLGAKKGKGVTKAIPDKAKSSAICPICVEGIFDTTQNKLGQDSIFC